MDAAAFGSARRGGGDPGTMEGGGSWAVRDVALTAREVGIEKRERDLADRLTTLKCEWKKRMERLEASRRQLLAGGAPHFPPLKIHLYDPDPRLLNALKEMIETAGLELEASGNYGAFVESVRESSRSGLFAVAVVGSVQDDSENVTRMAGLTTELVHVPRIYLSDLDLSTIRRRVLAAGANYFLEKPSGKAGGFAPPREALELLKADLLRVLEGVQRQHKAFFDAFMGCS